MPNLINRPVETAWQIGGAASFGSSESGNPMNRTDARQALNRALDRYWKRNVAVMTFLLLLWFLVGLGCGVLWSDVLNQYSLFDTGYPLGFWFAQQGSIIVFVVLILVYALWMNRLDRLHREEVRAISDSLERNAP
jgi:putative solute:sodium symporter small subunit